MVKKNSDDMLTRFHLIPERYGQTDRWTDRQTDRQTDRFAISISRVSMLTHDKNLLSFLQIYVALFPIPIALYPFDYAETTRTYTLFKIYTILSFFCRAMRGLCRRAASVRTSVCPIGCLSLCHVCLFCRNE